jgi:ABC-2 type transport system permease protein
MNLLPIPMWLLSGAFFPVDGAPVWIGLLVKLNPLTHSVAAIRAAVCGDVSTIDAGLPAMATVLPALLSLGAAVFLLDLWLVREEMRL